MTHIPLSHQHFPTVQTALDKVLPPRATRPVFNPSNGSVAQAGTGPIKATVIVADAVHILSLASQVSPHEP